jgi:uncharacterized membrane protein YfcA
MKMRLNLKMNLNFVVASSVAVLFLASLIAFFLYVPALSVITTLIILLALVLMFGLGAYAGGRRIRIKRRWPVGHAPSVPAH